MRSGHLDLENFLTPFEELLADLIWLARILPKEVIVKLSYHLDHQEIFHDLDNHRLEDNDVVTNDGNEENDDKLNDTNHNGEIRLLELPSVVESIFHLA